MTIRSARVSDPADLATGGLPGWAACLGYPGSGARTEAESPFARRKPTRVGDPCRTGRIAATTLTLRPGPLASDSADRLKHRRGRVRRNRLMRIRYLEFRSLPRRFSSDDGRRPNLSVKDRPGQPGDDEQAHAAPSDFGLGTRQADEGPRDRADGRLKKESPLHESFARMKAVGFQLLSHRYMVTETRGRTSFRL
jgi:hypothetical protein